MDRRFLRQLAIEGPPLAASIRRLDDHGRIARSAARSAERRCVQVIG
jgi:hypothetical protein